MTDEALKLQRFKEAVSADIDAQVARILDETQEQCDKMMESSRLTVGMDENAGRVRLRQEAELDYTRRISTARLGAQRNVLLRRGQLADEVFRRVTEKLAAFRRSSEYPEWLKKAVEQCRKKYPERRAEVRLAPEDMKYAAALGCEAQEDRSIALGGVIVGFEGVGAVIDCTFDSMFENERAEFSNNKELADIQE